LKGQGFAVAVAALIVLYPGRSPTSSAFGTGKNHSMKLTSCAAIAAACVIATSSPASAATITFNLGTQVVSQSPGDNTPLSASLPSVGTVTFTDIGAQTVQLMFQAGLEAGNEFFEYLVFNGSTGSDATHPRNQDLRFVQGATSGTFSAPTVGLSNDSYSLGPPNGFDIRLDFGNNTAATRFDGVDSIIYTITCGLASSCGAAGFNPLDALDFNVVNSTQGNPNPNYNGWFAAAALGYLMPGTTGDSNGARYGDSTGADNLSQAVIATPEPGSMMLLGTGVAALFVYRRKTLKARRA
jgi:hypothetical protein